MLNSFAKFVMESRGFSVYVKHWVPPVVVVWQVKIINDMHRTRFLVLQPFFLSLDWTGINGAVSKSY